VKRPRILITGAAGLIGGRLAEMCRDQMEVHCVVRKVNAGKTIDGVTYHELDLSEDFSDLVLPESIDYVVHLAQSSHFRNFPDKASDIFAVNVASTAKLLNFAHRAKVRNFVYASSGGVYESSAQKLNESTAIQNPNELGFYLASKFSGEILSQSYSKYYGVQILRLFIVYGAQQRGDMLIPRLVGKIRDGEPIDLEGFDGIDLRPTYLDDAVKAIMGSLDMTESNIVNVAGPEVLSLRTISEEIGVQLNRDVNFLIHSKKGQDLAPDISRMKKLLHTPAVGFSEGLNLTLSVR
jgi:UDP-glucose 4-epimerase